MRQISFPNPQSEAMEAVLQRIQGVGSLKATVEQVHTLRNVALLYEPKAVDYGYGIDSLRIYFEDGHRVCVKPNGAL